MKHVHTSKRHQSAYIKTNFPFQAVQNNMTIKAGRVTKKIEKALGC